MRRPSCKIPKLFQSLEIYCIALKFNRASKYQSFPLSRAFLFAHNNVVCRSSVEEAVSNITCNNSQREQSINSNARQFFACYNLKLSEQISFSTSLYCNLFVWFRFPAKALDVATIS